ncbi:MAG: hypothetical protein A2W31_07225 [Planctomycetes bacterium RBG_16_64_10]|nr:MAG: hypothetical protein A2W31_07225 [Planctomycetes bacterium RBG_16_64_10]
MHGAGTPGLAAEPEGGDLRAALSAVCAVGREGAGHPAARSAWQTLHQADAKELMEILAAMDTAGPLASNWLRAAFDSIAERAQAGGEPLPVAPLERFLADRRHASRPRRLAYEWIVQLDPTAPDRLLPGLLDDPSLELRRDAVARVLAAAGSATGDASTTLYRTALTAARDLDQIQACAEALAKLGEPIHLTTHLGYVLDWHLVGPFDNTDEKGFAVSYPPEQQVDFGAVYDGKSGPVQWFAHHTEHDSGVVDLNALFGKKKGVIAYAAVEFFAGRDQPVELRLGSINACKIWLNGALAGAYDTYHTAMAPDQYISPVQLVRGRNLILLKVCQNEEQESWTERWEFQLRVTDASGAAVHSCPSR